MNAIEVLEAIMSDIGDEGPMFRRVVNSEPSDLSNDELSVRIAIDERLLQEHDETSMRVAFQERYQATLDEADRRAKAIRCA